MSQYSNLSLIIMKILQLGTVVKQIEIKTQNYIMSNYTSKYHKIIICYHYHQKLNHIKDYWLKIKLENSNNLKYRVDAVNME